MLDRRLYQAICLSFLMLALSACNKKRQVLKVDYQVSGCFGSEKNELIIYKDNQDSLTAEFKKEGIIIQKTKLGEGCHPLIPLFIKELKALPETGICTTTGSYQVYVEGETINKKDYCSGWSGFSRLKYALFGTE